MAWKDRSYITKIRISAHKLNIESGRYTRLKLREKVASVRIVNELKQKHTFLLQCSKYGNYRLELFNIFKSNNNNDMMEKDNYTKQNAL